MNLAGNFLEQESSDARARVDRREDKQRLEHDGEVIPVLPQALECAFGARREALGGAVEDVGHSDRQRHRAAGPTAQGLLRVFLVHVDVLDAITAGDLENLVVELRHRRKLGVHRVVIAHRQ